MCRVPSRNSSPCAADGLAEDGTQQWQEDAIEPEHTSERVSSVGGSSEKGRADHGAAREGLCKGATSEDVDPAVVRLVVHTVGTDEGVGVGTGVIPPTNNSQNDGSCISTMLLCRGSHAKHKTQKAVAFAQEVARIIIDWDLGFLNLKAVPINPFIDFSNVDQFAFATGHIRQDPISFNNAYVCV
ncbi:hypothetical protein K488DRAFT_91459 [Vararia minispora EC-137]|uniref:Uncharacterized protein n=1 Tax=Vararia minispora EC-137 TaxID=1314806 RepID=A0ACB8Q5Q6_9AGAM|nr:hypothetical protein K488DRAFT_91459 [Vararia minispora EC-137]